MYKLQNKNFINVNLILKITSFFLKFNPENSDSDK
jgi:hypothetical protein